MGDDDRLVCVAPSNSTATSLATGTVFFQVLPSDDDAACQPTPYKIAMDGLVLTTDTTDSDGSISLPMSVGSTTTLDVSNTTYSIAIGPAVSPGLGIGLHNLAFNDLSWLQSMNSRAYWSPLIPLPGITLERSLDQLPRDLSPKLAAYLAKMTSGSDGTWINASGTPIRFQPDPSAAETAVFTTKELSAVESLVARYNASPSSLSPSELQLLREAVRIHVGGATPNAPFASYSVPGTKVTWTAQRAYRVSVKVSRSQALDISSPNDFNLGADALTNVSEAEVLVVGDQTGRIISVTSTKALNDGSWIFRNAENIRWGGRIVIVAGLAYSGYKIATADPKNRPRVIAEEAGGQIGGFAGAAIAGAVCLGFGIATGGVGLFACGVIGGIIGGLGGSALGGAAVE
jgi:hypothetical protein